MYNSLPRAVTMFLSKGLRWLCCIMDIDLLTFTEESWLFGYERFSVWVNNYLDKKKFNIYIRFAVAPDNVTVAYRVECRDPIRTTTDYLRRRERKFLSDSLILLIMRRRPLARRMYGSTNRRSLPFPTSRTWSGTRRASRFRVCTASSTLM